MINDFSLSLVSATVRMLIMKILFFKPWDKEKKEKNKLGSDDIGNLVKWETNRERRHLLLQ